MAETFRDAVIEYSLDGGTTYTSIATIGNALEVSGGERDTGEAYVFGQDTAIITEGKRKPYTVKVKMLYEDSGTGTYATIYDAYKDGTHILLRWTVDTPTAGKLQHTTTEGVIKSATPPQGATDSTDAIMTEFEVVAADIIKEVLA